jgi:hypothetical protein
MTLINTLKEIILHSFSGMFLISESSNVKRDLLSLQTEKIKYKIRINILPDSSLEMMGEKK